MGQPKESGRLVVIGASAGGVDALSTFVASLPAQFPASIVIAQHLSPHQPSALREILSRHCPLPVRTAAVREPLEEGVIYVVPADRHVEIVDHEIRLVARGQDRPKPSVDLLFSSAARQFGDRLVAVVLSGSGSDGAVGARDVKLAGGLVVIQNPDTASFPSMPRSVPPSMVDFAVDLPELGPLLSRLVVEGADRPADEAGQALPLLIERLREQGGIDFSQYKQPTILRRLHVRMNATHQPSLDAYVRYLERNPDEHRRLVASFLIKATQFFRDPPLFDHLRDVVLPELIQEAKAHNRELRLWSAGCATGEEAYSLAILVAEALGDGLDGSNVRVFATDADGAAIALARRAAYPASSVTGLPAKLRDRYFVPADGGVQVVKPVRELVVFGQHDLGLRAPFPRIDLVLCRNVLIYFTPELQRRVLQVFAFSLRAGGRLVLGKSETVRVLAEYFAVEEPLLRIYKREPGPKPVPAMSVPAVPTRVTPSRRGPDAASTRMRVDVIRAQGATERAAAVLQNLPIGVAVLGARYELDWINTSARHLLGIHGSAIGDDFVHLAEVLPSSSLRRAIDAARRGEPNSEIHEVHPPDLPRAEPLQLEVTCSAQQLATGQMGVVVTLAEVTETVAGRRHTTALEEQLERSIETARRLLEANDEITAANTSMRATNEELLLSAEEAQSAREEVETLNEELQASNEELETLNEELQASVEELNTANDDLQARTDELGARTATLAEERSRLAAILSGMGDAVLAVDRSGRPIVANEAYERMFGGLSASWRPEDEHGDPLPADQWPQQRAARGESFTVSFSVVAQDGQRHWLEAGARPISSEDASWAGVVVLRDVSDRSLRVLQEQFTAAASHELRTPAATLHGYLQLAQRALSGARADDAALYLDKALGQTRRLGDQIGRLFDLAQVETGQIQVDLEPIDLAALVRQTVEVAQVLEEATKLHLTSPPGPLMIRGDAARLEQVLFNLISNATVHGVGSDRVDIRLRASRGQAQIEVIDRGPGIPADVLPRLFSRFPQPLTGNRHKDAGLGLGLFLSRQIVVAHGGTITARSKPGTGTRVVVRLPLIEEAPSTGPAEAPQRG